MAPNAETNHGLSPRQSSRHLRCQVRLGVDHLVNIKRALIVDSTQDLSGAWIDEVYLLAGVATHGLIGLLRVLGAVVRAPALHAVARVGASKQEGGHGSSQPRSQRAALRHIKSTDRRARSG